MQKEKKTPKPNPEELLASMIEREDWRGRQEMRKFRSQSFPALVMFFITLPFFMYQLFMLRNIPELVACAIVMCVSVITIGLL